MSPLPPGDGGTADDASDGPRPSTKILPGPDAPVLRAIKNLDKSLRAHLEWRLSLSQQFLVGEIACLDYLNRALPHDGWIPPGVGWAATYDTIAYLVRHVLESERECSILELGGGSSTVWMALAIRKAGRGRLTSLDHDLGYLQTTQGLLERNGVADVVELLHAPLTQVDVAGETYSWYSPTAVQDRAGFTMLFVDGPPGTTGGQARFPAYPLLAGHLADGALIVLDDANRPDEIAVLDHWKAMTDVGLLEPHEHLSRSEVLRYRRPRRG